MHERTQAPPEEAENWQPEQVSHYSDKGAHKKRSDFWKTLRRQVAAQDEAALGLVRADLANIVAGNCQTVAERGVTLKQCGKCGKCGNNG